MTAFEKLNPEAQQVALSNVQAFVQDQAWFLPAIYNMRLSGIENIEFDFDKDHLEFDIPSPEFTAELEEDFLFASTENLKEKLKEFCKGKYFPMLKEGWAKANDMAHIEKLIRSNRIGFDVDGGLWAENALQTAILSHTSPLPLP